MICNSAAHRLIAIDKPEKHGGLDVKPRTWLRIAAGLLGLFTVLHTLGTVRSDNQTPGIDALNTTMRNFHYNIMGSDRTAWDFFHGLGLLFSVNLLILTILSWQVGSLAHTDPTRTRPLAITLVIADVLIMVLSWMYFFIAPVVLSALAAACTAYAASMLTNRKPEQTA